MAITPVVVTVNLANVGLEPQDGVITAVSSVPLINDLDGNRLFTRTASARITDGVGSISLIPTDAATDPTDFSYTLTLKARGSTPLRLEGVKLPSSDLTVELGSLVDLDPDTTPTTYTGSLANHLADPTAAHAASAISYAGSSNLAATDVEGALDELAAGHSGETVNLKALGLTGATTDIATVIAAAVTAGYRRIIVPYAATAWPALTTITLSGIHLEFEPGARISFNHASVGMSLTSSRLTRAHFTSTHTGPASVGDATSTDYAFPAREVTLNDGNVIDGSYYHENACNGLHITGSGNRILCGVTFQHIRHQRGWAAALHCSGATCYDNRITGPVTIDGCDRGIEVEDGAHDVQFLGGGYLTDIYPNGYTGSGSAVTYETYTFVIDAHAHEGSGGVESIIYGGTWTLENCGSGVSFLRSTGTNDADMPRGCRVDDLHIIGRALSTGAEDIALQGHDHHIGRVRFEEGAGIAGGAFRVKGFAGSRNNRVAEILAATNAALPTITDDGTGLRAGESGDFDFMSTVGYDPGLAAVIFAGGSQTWPTANAALLTRVRVRRNLTVNKLVWVVGTSSGVYDIGIYDASGTRVWSKGSTAVPANGTVVTETVSPGVVVRAGEDFFVAMAANNTTFTLKAAIMPSVEVTKSITGKGAVLNYSSSIPLPSSVSISSGGSTIARVPAITIRES